MRDPGDIFWYDFPLPIGPHPVVIVSREDNRNAVIAVMITSRPQRAAPDTLPLAGLDCERFVRGWARGDLVANLPRNDDYWRQYLGRMNEEDLRRVRKCVCAAVDVVVD